MLCTATQIFHVQAKISTVRTVFPDYLSVSYDYVLTQDHLVFVNIKYFFGQYQHLFVDTRLLFEQRQTFCFNKETFFVFNTKFLFWASFRMLCHGDIFLLSHSNKNIISCQKINQISFLCDTKK